MGALGWIVAGGLLMTLISLVGSAALLLPDRVLQRLLLPLVAFAAGSLIGGALFHMLPAVIDRGAGLGPFAWLAAGFLLFMALEQFLHLHHCHRAEADCRAPLTYLVLIGDGLHNFLGGIAVGSAFVIDVRVGMTTWLAAAAHEIPQELGDFGVLVHGGWSKRRALLMNLVSAATFLLGGLLAWGLSSGWDVSPLVALAAGNFLYIGAVDLVPEVNRHGDLGRNVEHFVAFAAGLGLLLLVRLVGHG